MMHPDHDINNVCLTLTNEGTLYEHFKHMARQQSPLNHWRDFVRMYGKRFAGVLLLGDDCTTAARLLRDYYANEIGE